MSSPYQSSEHLHELNKLIRALHCNSQADLYEKKLQDIHLGVSKNSGTPKWMVYNGKPY